MTTPIDDIMKFMNDKKQVRIKDVYKNFSNMTEKTIDNFIEILKEDKILKIEFKGFDSFIKINEKSIQKKIEDEIFDFENLKFEFIKRAEIKKIDERIIFELFKKFVNYYEEDLKKNFDNNFKIKSLSLDRSRKVIQKSWGQFKLEYLKS